MQVKPEAIEEFKKRVVLFVASFRTDIGCLSQDVQQVSTGIHSKSFETDESLWFGRALKIKQSFVWLRDMYQRKR